MHAKRPQARHHGDESPEGEPHDAEGPVRGIPESVEEDFAERLRGPVVPRVEVEGGHFVDGVDAEEEV